MSRHAFVSRQLRSLGAVSLALAMVSLLILVLIFVGIIVLRPFGIIIPSADEFASITLVGVFVLGLAAAVAHDEHISVLFVVDALPAVLRQILAILAVVVSIVMVGYLCWGSWRLWYAALMRGTMLLGSLPIPRAVPLGVMLLGLLMFEVALILRLVVTLGSLRASHSPDPRDV